MRWLMASPSPVPPRRRLRCAVDLVERLEQRRHGVGCDADAGVADLEDHADMPVRRLRAVAVAA